MELTKEQLEELCRLYDSDIPFLGENRPVDEKEMKRFRKLIEKIKKEKEKENFS